MPEIPHIVRRALSMMGEWSTEELIALRDGITAEIERRDVCEHGTQLGEWCQQCRDEYRAAARQLEDPQT